MALQYGVPLKVLCNKFTHSRFEPSGFTNNPKIPFAKSIMDYIFRWLAMKFLSRDDQLRFMSEEFVEDNEPILQNIEQGKDDEISSLPVQGDESKTQTDPLPNQTLSKLEQQEKFVFLTQADAPNCSECGSIMERNGNC